MNACPNSINGGDKRLILFVWGQCGSMPPSAPVQHVENNILMNEEKVTFHLLVKLIRYLNAACVARPGLLPLSADSTGLHYLWDEIEDFLRNPNSFQEAFHGVL